MPRNAPPRKKYRPPASRAQGVTMERAVEIAFERHRAGNLDDAEPIYAAVLDAQPDHVDVLSHMGILKYQRGQHDEHEVEPLLPGRQVGEALLERQGQQEACGELGAGLDDAQLLEQVVVLAVVPLRLALVAVLGHAG